MPDSSTVNDIVSDSVQLLTSAAGIAPGFLGIAVAYVALPVARVVASSIADPAAKPHDSSTATMLYEMAEKELGSDKERAVELLQQAAELGSDKALLSLGCMAESQDPKTATALFERAAALGNTTARLRLAYQMEKTDPVRAKAIFKELADQDNGWGMVNYARLIARDDVDASDALLVKTMRKHHKEDAGMEAACLYIMNHKDDKGPGINFARKGLKSRANRGDTQAMRWYAKVMQDIDPEQSLYYYQQLAKTGNSADLNNLALFIRDTDPYGAIALLIQAADKENITAVMNLAHLFQFRQKRTYDAIKEEVARDWREDRERPAEAALWRIVFHARSLERAKDYPKDREWVLVTYNEYLSNHGWRESSVRVSLHYLRGFTLPDGTEQKPDLEKARTFMQTGLRQDCSAYATVEYAKELLALDPEAATKILLFLSRYNQEAARCAHDFLGDDTEEGKKAGIFYELSRLTGTSDEVLAEKYPELVPYRHLYTDWNSLSESARHSANTKLLTIV